MTRIKALPGGCRSASRASWLAILLAGLTACGCGGSGPTTTVRGKISYEGKPVTHGVINFIATGAKPLGGPIKPDGTYEVQLPVGEYKVRIDAPPRVPPGYKEGDPLPELEPRLIPEQYGNFVNSGLTATIKDESDPQQLDFPLP